MADTTFTYGPSNVTTLLSLSMEKRKKDIADAVFNQIPTFEFLNSEGRVLEDGGVSIVAPLMTSRSTAAGFYDGYGELDVTPQDPFTSTQYKWKQAYASISVNGREVAQNQGAGRIANLVESKQMHAEKSLKDVINEGLHASSPGSEDITSLVTLIDATSTIGDINSTSNSYWQSLVTTGGVFASQGVADWRTTANTLMLRGGSPKLILTTQTVHEAYEGTLVPQKRYANDSTGNARFNDIMFGDMKVRFDGQCASGVSYFLDPNALALYVHENRNFTLDEWVKIPDQDARVTQLFVMLELAAINRRLLAKVTTQS